jgi:hypothetical protein
VVDNYQINRKVRDYVVINLREGFKTHSKYTYVEDAEGIPDLLKTKIIITDVTPNEVYKVPVVYVDTVSGPESRMLDSDLLSDRECHYTNSTYLPLTVNVRVRSYDTIVRDELTDAIYQMLKEHLYDLSDNGIGVRNMDFIPETREFIQDRWFYVSGITVRTISEWVEEYSYDAPIASGVNVIVTIAEE